MREQLSNEVAGVINDFGPKLYEDFNKVCNLPQAFRPPNFCISGECYLLRVPLLQLEPLVCGAERVILELSMLKVWV
jgi:hypothetical protein